MAVALNLRRPDNVSRRVRKGGTLDRLKRAIINRYRRKSMAAREVEKFVLV